MGVLSDDKIRPQIWLVMSAFQGGFIEFDPRLRYENIDDASELCARLNRINTFGFYTWIVLPAYGEDDPTPTSP